MSGGFSIPGGAGAKINTKRGKALLLAATSAATLLLAHTTRAGTDVWVGNTTNAWSDPNWTGTNNPPQTNDGLIFNAAGTSGGNLNNNLTSSAFNISGITFSSSASAYNIGNGTTTANAGNAFVLTGAITDSGAAAETINNPFTLTSSQSFSGTLAGGSLNLTGNITATGVTLTTNGGASGAQVAFNTNLSGTDSFGAIAVQGNAADGQIFANNPTTTFNNATLNVTGGITVGRSNLVFSGNTVATITGAIGKPATAGNQDWSRVTLQGNASVSCSSFNISTGVTGGFNLAGGTLTTGSIYGVESTDTANNLYFNHNYFNGTQMVPTQNNASFLNITKSTAFTGAATGYLDSGGAVFNTSGFNIGTNVYFVNDTGQVGTLTKLGLGTLTLSNRSSGFTGAITINGGTLLASSANNFTIATSVLGNPQVAHNVNVNNGGTLQFGLNDTLGGTANPIAETLVINSGGTVTNTAGYYNSLGPVTLNGGTLTAVGGGTTSYQAYQLGGTVTVGGSSPATISGSGTNDGYHLPGVVTFNVAATGGSGADLTVSAPLIGPVGTAGGAAGGGINKTGAGTMLLTSANTYSGATNVSSGTLTLGPTGSISTSSPVYVAGTLNLGSATTFASLSGSSTGVTSLGTNSLSLTSGGTYAGAITGSGTLTLSGGSFILPGSASIAGSVFSAANLSLQNSAINSASIGGGIVLSNASLSFDLGSNRSSDTLNVAGATSFNGTTAINLALITGQTLSTGNYTLMNTSGGLTTGGGNFTRGTLPTGFNAYNFNNTTSTSLILSVVANAPVVGADYWTGLASSSTTPVDSSNLWGYGSGLATPRSNWSTTANGLTDPLQVPGSQSDVIFTASNANASSGTTLTTTLDGGYVIDSLTFAGTGTSNITAIGINTGANTLTISGANNGGKGIVLTAASLASGTISGTTGGTVIVNGSQSWANNNATLGLNVSTGITALSGATSLTFNGSGAGGIVLGGVIGNGTGTLGLVLNQAGVTQISGNNTFTGGVTIHSGTVQLKNAGAFNSTAPNSVTFDAGNTADLQLNGNSLAIPGISSASTATNIENAGTTAATLSDTATSGVNTFAGTVQNGTGGGVLSLTKSGASTLVLSGSATYSGLTTVNTGATLVISGTNNTSGGVTVNSGGTLVLSGTNLIGTTGAPANSGNVIVHSGATLQLQANTGNTTSVSGVPTSNVFGIPAQAIGFQLTDNAQGNFAYIQLRGDSSVAFANTATGNSSGAGGTGDGSGSTRINFDVNDVTSGVTGNTLGFGALGTFKNIINVTGGNGYSLALAGISNGNGQFVTFNPTTANVTVGPIVNTSVVTMAGTGTLFLANNGSTGSSNTGIYDFASGITNVAGLTDYGTAGPIGARAASQETATGNGIGLLFEGGTLQYNGSTAQETNRQIRLSNNSTNTIDASGSNPAATVNFSYSGTNTNLFETAGTRTLNLTGTNTGQNIFSIGLTDQGTNPTSLTKSGAGTWVLTGSNSYSGATQINAGTLALNSGNPVLISTSLINIASGATFDISANSAFALASTSTLAGTGTVNGFYNHVAGTLSPGGTGTVGTLSFNNDLTLGGGILRLDLNGSSTTIGSGVNDLIAVTGNLDLSSGTTTTLTVANSSTPANGSTYTVITYTGSLNTDGQPHLISPSRSYSIITSVPGAIELQYTSGVSAANLVWNSSSDQNWDNTTQNWFNIGTSAVDTFYSGDKVAFNDTTASPVATPQTTINLSTVLLPASVSVNTNTSSYTFSGTGGIGGTATLTKTGSSVLTIATSNTYSGDTNVQGGTVVTANTTGGGLGTGNLNISSGATVQIGNATATPIPTNIAINNNGALTFNSSTGMTLGMPIYGSGVLNQTGTNLVLMQTQNYYTGGTNILSGTIESQNGTALGTGLININGGVLFATQSGGGSYTNAFNLSSPSSNTALHVGGGGTTSISGPVALTGNAILQMDGNTTLSLLNLPAALSGNNFNLTVNGDGNTVFALGGSANLGTGTITTGANTLLQFVPPAATTITIASSFISGNGVQQAGLGTTILNTSNTYSGGTQVVSGSLEVANSNALGNSSAVVINGGTPLAAPTGNLALSGGVTLSQPFALGGRGGTSSATPEIVNLDSANTLTGTIGTLGGGNNYIIESDGGTLTISGNLTTPSTVTGAHSLDLQGTAAGVWSGTIANGAAASNGSFAVITVAKSGSGTWNLSAGNTYTGGTVINAGLLIAANGLSSVGSGPVTVNGGEAIFTATPASTIFAMLQSGYNGGAWNGATGINSTAAAGDTTHLHAVGFIQPTSATTFAGQSLGTGDVAIKYTYYGDANLDGKVDGSDYSRIDFAYLNDRNPSNTQLTGWQNGDFNYDGVVNGSDYTLIDNAFNSQGASISAEIASATSQIAGAGPSSAVPEPASLGLFAMGALGLLGRRRPRHH